jgi:hypothetical protein
MTDNKKLEAENAKLRTENTKLWSAMEELLWYTWQLECDVCAIADNVKYNRSVVEQARAALGGDK